MSATSVRLLLALRLPSLFACMIAHALVDSLIIFLPALLKKLAARVARNAREQSQAARPS